MWAMEHRGCRAPLLTSALCKVLHNTSEDATPVFRSPMPLDADAKLHSLEETLQELKASINGISNTQQYILQTLRPAGYYEEYLLSAAPSQLYPAWSGS